MVDTVRSLSDLQTLLATNSSGGISAQDLRDLLVSTYSSEAHANLENGKTSTDTPDDDFDTGSLDVKWTVVDGSSGTVGLLSNASSNIYDLSTRQGNLLLQTYESNKVTLRQDYTLPDGNCIIMAINSAVWNDNGVTNNEIQVGISLNQSTTEIFPTDGFALLHDTVSTTASQILAADGNTTFGSSGYGVIWGHTTYFRICRSGSTYYGFYSFDGISWSGCGSTTSGIGAYDRIWIFNNSSTGAFNPNPIATVKWIRQGSNGVDPW